MELFKLLGTVAIDASDAKNEIDSTTSKAEKSSGKMVQAFKTIGTAVVAFFAVDKIVDFGKSVMTLGDTAQSAMNGFAAATGASGDALKDFDSVMKSIYANNFGESLEDVANAMTTVKQQAGDIGADELEFMTTTALMLRDTFDMEVNESMRSAKMLMDQFKLSGKEAFTLIAQGAQNGLDKNGDLLDSVNEYAVHYKQLGFTAEGFFNSLVNGAKAGTFSVDKLGDAMKEFGIRAKDGSDTSLAAFDMLNLDAEEMFETFNKGGASAAKATNEVIKRLQALPDGVAKTTAGVALFGTMWEDLGAEGIAALANVNGGIAKTADTLQQINDIKYNDWNSAMAGVKRKIETSILMPISQKLLPLLTNGIPKKLKAIEKIAPVIVDAFEFAVNGITNFATAVSEFAQPILQGIFEWFAEKWETFGKPAFENIMSVAKKLGNICAPVFSHMSSVFGMLWDIVSTRWKEIGAPIFALIQEAIEYVAEQWSEKTGSMKTFFENALVAVESVWNEIGKPTYEALGEALRQLVIEAEECFPLIEEAFAGLVAEMESLWTEDLKPVFDEIGGAYTSLMENMDFTMISEVFATVLDFIGTVWNNVGRPIFDVIAHAIAALFKEAGEETPAIVKLFKDIIAGLVDSWENHLKPVFVAIGNIFNNVLKPIVNFLVDVLTPVIGVAITQFGNFLLSLKTLSDSIFDILAGILSLDADKIFSGIENALASFFEVPMKNLESLRDLFLKFGREVGEFFAKKINWEFPKIKLPKFTITPAGWSLGDLLKGSIPKLGIEWFAKGGIFDEPTIFPTASGLKGVGEAGPEAVTPIDVLQKYVADAVASQNAMTVEAVNYGFDRLMDFLQTYIPDMANMQLVTDTGALVGELAPAMDVQLGILAARNGRGMR